MSRADTLRLLLAAEVPRDLASIEATLRAITERIDLLAPGSSVYMAAHTKIDALLAAREALIRAADPADPGGG